jgi:hypothetical protein
MSQQSCVLKISYPTSFVKQLKKAFPNEIELHEAAKEGLFILGNLICDKMKGNSSRKEFFSKWCRLPCVLDATARILCS